MKSRLMKLAINEAKKSWNATQPNPAVGAVIVKDGESLGFGRTLPAGSDHAEIQAIKNAGDENLTGSTMYVTLEPCSHYGKTSPCTDAIINSGITKVVIGCKDLNPQVNGGGIKKLQDAGIEVEEYDPDSKIAEMYKSFFCFSTKKRPYITLKLAQSKNGCIAGADKTPINISIKESRVWVHNLRATADAILISGSTAQIDNPLLDARFSNFKYKQNPKRIILAFNSDLPPDLKIFRNDGIKTIVFTKNKQNLPEHIKQYFLPGVNFKTNFEFLLKKLYEENIHHILIEPGAILIKNILNNNLFDEFYLFTSPNEIEDGYKWGGIGDKKIELIKKEKVGEDWLEKYKP
ncbi:bifunctional diaminohydroxyphosphoribosylaminopyrimidine deaminase/5-amino-6-(5-phosphoribosylamino)uracil reductase RibD [Patescibacteria group bacterium]|nr:bifunctional diaminohydroxyphosphoribosylaminopyrimidine deaminase/5-amino-6-(5-phosphoribosylamino)uracil reductase RibD [Patescibacteria group bacterium]